MRLALPQTDPEGRDHFMARGLTIAANASVAVFYGLVIPGTSIR